MLTDTSRESPTDITEAEIRRERFERFRKWMKAKPGTFAGVPSWFRGCCATASCGGGNSYAEAGYHLGLHVRTLEPYDVEPDDWLATIAAELAPLVEREEDAAVVAWLVRRYPRCMVLIPFRRRAGFVAGLYRGFAKGGDE